ncbi:MAG: glycosyltransferase family 87 protein [Acidimicrobiia bacterium]|nr:glycosyltransferase family 87 protein [Acidimicrobiia bacterium]
MALVSQRFVVQLAPRAVVAVVAIVALVPALLVLVGRDQAANDLGGDFPSFYAAGRIVLDGDADDLYDAAVQRSAQAPYHDDEGDLIYFPYPPFVAAGYAGLAWLPYGVALTAHTLLALAALVWAMWLVVPTLHLRIGRLDGTLAGSAIMLAAYPVVTAVLGGQNTTFTVLIFALVWRSVASGQLITAGVVGGLLVAKPQFGLVLFAVLVVARLWSAVAAFAATGVVIGALTAFGWGWDWPRVWLDQVQRFGEANEVVSGSLMINIVGWFGNLTDAEWAHVVALVGVAAVAMVAGRLVWRLGVRWATFGAVTATVLLVSPATLFYDLGLALAGYLVIVALDVERDHRSWMVAAVVVLSWSQLLAGSLGWSPLFLVLVGLWGYAVSSADRIAIDVAPARADGSA